MLDPNIPPTEAKIVALNNSYERRGFYIIPWTVNGPAPETYAGYPERASGFNADLIRRKRCKRLAGRPTPNLVFFDCDKDFEAGARAVYHVLGLDRGLEYRSPNGLYIVVRRPLGAPILHGTNKHAKIGLHDVDVFTSESVPVTLPGSWKPQKGDKKGGHYYVTHRPDRLPVLSPRALDLIKPPPVPVREPAQRAEYCGELHPVCESILNSDLEKLASCSEGSRNKTLFSISANLYAIAATGEIPMPPLEAMLVNAAKANGLVDDKKYKGIIDVKKTIENGRKRGLANPRCLASYRENYDRKRARGKNGGRHA